MPHVWPYNHDGPRAIKYGRHVSMENHAHRTLELKLPGTRVSQSYSTRA